MGLKTFPEGYSGSYTGFALLRTDIAGALGYQTHRPTKLMAYYVLDEQALGLNVDRNILFGNWPEPPEDPALALLIHYDNEGIISSEIAMPLAERIEEALERIPQSDPYIPDRNPRSQARNLARGLREAAESGRPLEFQ